MAPIAVPSGTVMGACGATADKSLVCGLAKGFASPVAQVGAAVLGQLAQSGESITIVQADQPVAELKPVTTDAKSSRPIGLYEGEFVVPDDFDDPLPDEILKGFEGR